MALGSLDLEPSRTLAVSSRESMMLSIVVSIGVGSGLLNDSHKLQENPGTVNHSEPVE